MGEDLATVFCVLGLEVDCLLEVGEAFFRLSIALESVESVSWIFLSSRLSEGDVGGVLRPRS